jgi:hypothetical protein
VWPEPAIISMPLPLLLAMIFLSPGVVPPMTLLFASRSRIRMPSPSFPKGIVPVKSVPMKLAVILVFVAAALATNMPAKPLPEMILSVITLTLGELF